MVQLTDELLAGLDREAQRLGLSRSALIRDAIVTFLAQRSQAEDVRKYVDGYRRQPPGRPDGWGQLDRDADLQGHDLALRLDEEERVAGLSW